jgi:L-ascorbate metabolism protein UlaG (beta-lactamase superfamily)
MQIRWHGQSAFQISAKTTVFVDPFGAMEGLAARGMQFDYRRSRASRPTSCS